MLVSQYISKAPVHKSPVPRPLNKQISFQQLSEDWQRQWRITDGRRKAVPDTRSGDGKYSVSQWRRRTRDVQHHAGGWAWTITYPVITACSDMSQILSMLWSLVVNLSQFLVFATWTVNRDYLLGVVTEIAPPFAFLFLVHFALPTTAVDAPLGRLCSMHHIMHR